MSVPLLIAVGGRARSGKDTVTAQLAPLLGAAQYAFAEPMKIMLKSVFGDHFHTGDRERICPEAGVSYRRLMQTLGTEWGRQQVNEELWLRLVDKFCQVMWEDRSDLYGRRWKGRPVILSDLRFANEARWVKNKGGVVIHVSRPGIALGAAASSHASEKDESREYADYHILNDGTLEDLEMKVKLIAGIISGNR